MQLCEEEITAAIHYRKLPPNGRKSSPVWRHGMFGGKIYVAGGAGIIWLRSNPLSARREGRWRPELGVTDPV